MIERKPSNRRSALLIHTATTCFLFTAVWCGTAAQETQQKPAAEPAPKSAEKADQSEKTVHPAQIELLETKVRFEANGDSGKEVHALVKINSELGVRQFAQLNFDFNRSFESVEIPMVHIIHANGGTADILPSGVTDRPNPAVVNFPAYQDVRVKSVRILGLQPGDTLEYRVTRTVSRHPLAPDFWLDHTFDRSGVVSHEIFELDLPAARQMQIHINPNTPPESQGKSDSGNAQRTTYRWELNSADLRKSERSTTMPDPEPDIVITTFQNWSALGDAIGKLLEPSPQGTKSASTKAREIMRAVRSDTEKLQVLYDLVAQKIAAVDLPIGSTGFRTRQPDEIFRSGYATTEDKFALLSALASDEGMESRMALFGATSKISDQLPRPSLLTNSAVLVHIPSPPENVGHGQSKACDHCGTDHWLVPSMEIAPFEVIPSNLRGKQAFVPHFMFDISPFLNAPSDPPFLSTQLVHVDSTLEVDGKLTAKVHYSMRGDNELILRVAFHHTPKDRWKEVAQLLSITDGFRGQVTNVNVSDPYATKEPFSVQYELDQPKFVDWSKKPVRIPALLPQLGLPDPPAKPGSATAPIELGTPLEVETKMTLHLPPGTRASAPAGTSVERDYATYSSQYSANGSTLTATRRIKFVLREVPAARAADYNAFLRAVQSDEAQDFTLERATNPTPKTNEPKPVPPEP